jgi:intracellular septation protein
MALITFVLGRTGGRISFFHNDEFIKWKVTVESTLLVPALLIASGCTKPLIQRMRAKS